MPESSTSTNDLRPGASSFREYLFPPGHPRLQELQGQDARGHADRFLAESPVAEVVRGWTTSLEETSFDGIRADETIRQGLFELGDEGFDVAAVVAAADALAASIDEAQRGALLHPVDHYTWRAWMNPELYIHRFGLRLEEISAPQVDAVFALLKASLSSAGYEKVRALLRLNAFLGEVVDAPGVLNELSYNINLFGQPSLTEPWGWNFYGHHVCINCVVVGTQVVMTPVFFGAEPNRIDTGPHAGADPFAVQERAGLGLVRSLSLEQAREAVLYKDKRDPQMPPGRLHPADELHLAGAFQDNRLIPYEGVCASALTQQQQGQLVDLLASFLDYLPESSLQARLLACRAHLAETYFCWIGGTGDDDVFYYRVQSPVVLVEYDHHAGIFLANDEPQKFHTHTVVRTPNGNDYGVEIRRLHDGMVTPPRLVDRSSL